MILSILMDTFYIYSALFFGLFFLIWSADKFVEGAGATAHRLGMPPLLIGMLIIGFGTSAPEIFVSIISSIQGNPSIALGNAYGSNITNIALILGVTALINPVRVESGVIKKELPLLTFVTLFTYIIIADREISRLDAVSLMAIFFGMLYWTINTGLEKKRDPLATEVKQEMEVKKMPLSVAIFWLITGVIMMIISSRALVWGAVGIAHMLQISDLIIGLTVVTIGTSLPELASSIIATRKGDHDLALGNVIGSNLFNTLTVVGSAGIIRDIPVPLELLRRDYPVMTLLTLSLFVMGYGFKKQGVINRIEGFILLLAFVIYNILLFTGFFQN